MNTHRIAILQILFNQIKINPKAPAQQFYIRKLQQGKSFKLWGEWFNPVGSHRIDPIN